MSKSRDWRWFRLYTEWMEDPKIQQLPERDQRRHVMLMCMAAKGLLPADDKTIAFCLRITPKSWQTTAKRLRSAGLLTENNSLPTWESRQFSSDHSGADRMRKLRSRLKGEKCAVTVTSQNCHRDVTVTAQKQNQIQRQNQKQNHVHSSNDSMLQSRQVQSNTISCRLSPTSRSAGPSLDDARQVIDAWNQVAKTHGYKQSRGLKGALRKVQARLRDPDFRDHWQEATTRLLEKGPHPHLAGNNDRNWIADLEWFLTHKALRKILDGSWDKPAAKRPKNRGTQTGLPTVQEIEADLAEWERQEKQRRLFRTKGDE